MRTSLQDDAGRDLSGLPAPGSGLVAHFKELRLRLFKSILAVILGTVVAAFFVDPIFQFLLKPIAPYIPGDKKLVILSPLEPVVIYLKIAVVAGIFIVIPYILYQLWAFVAPGLYVQEKRLVAPFLILGTLFFTGGAAFGFFVFLPMTMKFLVSMTPAQVAVEYSVERYFSLMVHFLLAMALIFELPLVIALLSMIGVVTTRMLKRFRRYAIILAFVISAVVTPTVDPYSQVFMAVPIIVFYEIGILLSWLLRKKEKQSI